MPKVKILARQWGLYIASEIEKEFQKIGGIESFTLSNDAESTETTDFDSGGYNESLVSGRSQEIEIEGSFIVDVETGDRDEGQQIIEELSTRIGHESTKSFRLVSPAGVVTEYTVHSTLGDQGGGLTDKTSWGATMTVSGKPRTIDTATDTSVYKDKDGNPVTVGKTTPGA